jgi:hypothetical protein
MLFAKDKKLFPEVTERGLSYKWSSYRFEEISHLVFTHSSTTINVNFVKRGDLDRVQLSIILTNGEKIEISFNEANTWADVSFAKKKTIEINSLVDLYVSVAKTTFVNRLQYYLRQLDERGYFLYEDCRFYPGDRIVFRNKDFHLRSTKFLKGYGRIEMYPKEETILGKINRTWVITLPPLFKTEIDPDVISYLLEKYFGLKWS